MLKRITPFTALINGEDCVINAIKLTNFKGYDFSEDAKGTVEYVLGFEDANNIFKPLQNTTIVVSKDICLNLGSNDNAIAEFIVNEKGF
jgi:hypothetical protein